jgi:hypothetical protein
MRGQREKQAGMIKNQLPVGEGLGPAPEAIVTYSSSSFADITTFSQLIQYS